MNFQESADRNMNFYVFARDLNKHLLDHNYNMVSTYNNSAIVYNLPFHEDGSSFNFFIINYDTHIISYRDIPENDDIWHDLDFRLELITQRDLDALKNMATNIQEQTKKIKVEYKLKDLEKDFE